MVSYHSKKVLITGGAGFVGGRLAERLVIEHKADVRVLVRDWPRAVWISRLPVDLVLGDMTDRHALSEAVQGCEIVFHCASGGNSTAEYMQTNVVGTRKLLECCHAAGVSRFVYLSSIAVHGPNPPDNADEQDEYRTMGRGYSDSKIEAEKLVFEFGRRCGMPVVVIRPTFVWGPRSSLFTVRPLMSMTNATFRLVDQGSGDCHAVYVDNLVDAVLAAGVRPEAAGEAFLVTDGYGITWSEFFDYYARWLEVESIPSLSSRSVFVRLQARGLEVLSTVLHRLRGNPAPLWRRAIRRGVRTIVSRLERRGILTPWDLAKYARRGRLNTDKARRLLGYQARWSLADAMHETEKWVRDQLGVELGLGEALTQPPVDRDGPSGDHNTREQLSAPMDLHSADTNSRILSL